MGKRKEAGTHRQYLNMTVDPETKRKLEAHSKQTRYNLGQIIDLLVEKHLPEPEPTPQ